MVSLTSRCSQPEKNKCSIASAKITSPLPTRKLLSNSRALGVRSMFYLGEESENCDVACASKFADHVCKPAKKRFPAKRNMPHPARDSQRRHVLFEECSGRTKHSLPQRTGLKQRRKAFGLPPEWSFPSPWPHDRFIALAWRSCMGTNQTDSNNRRKPHLASREGSPIGRTSFLEGRRVGDQISFAAAGLG